MNSSSSESDVAPGTSERQLPEETVVAVESGDVSASLPVASFSGASPSTSMRDSAQETVDSSNATIAPLTTNSAVDDDDNMDSGIGTEKSESGSSDIVMVAAEQMNTDNPPVPSTSADPDREQLLSLRKYFKGGRNFRIRIPVYSPDSDDDTRMDSSGDDDEEEEEREDNASCDDSVIDMNDDNESDSTIELERYWYDVSPQNEDSNEYDTPHVLLKRKPKHEWNVVAELFKRETGTVFRPGKSGRSDSVFEQRFYGSLRTVERLELMYKLNKHKGCVNSINFHPEGNLLASGSDDLNIIIWEWATNTVQKVVRTHHKSNIFQSRFLHLNCTSQIDIVSCARDGQVLLTQVLSSGGTPIRRHLAQHSRSAHKLYTNAAEPHVVVSAGEDAHVFLSDVRLEKPNKLLTVKENNLKVPLFSVVCHPLNVHEMCVAGQGRKVMVFDRRKAGSNAEPIKTFCPDFFRITTHPAKKKPFSLSAYITCAVYNYNGTEILASYNDDDIYLFDTVADCESNNSGLGFTSFYCGHRNSATFKGVSFFGPRSEFVVSGSDCSYIYIWEKKTEAIVQWMMGDEGGVVNCVESHPRFPVLATSGLDKDVKIWVPSYESDPKLNGLRETVMKNAHDRSSRPLTHFLPTLFDIYRGSYRDRTDESESFSDGSDSQHDEDRENEHTY